MNENFTDRFDSFASHGDAQPLSTLSGSFADAETPRERRRRLQRNTMLGLAIAALLVLVVMIITRAMEIASI
ncbi:MULTISPECIES: hypothetical protein [Roseobacteraceae]|uniref:hypothetical protein n=1 Tax=Roseobacteraceae TaxID=2854170 RepID=UPI00080AB4CC|nr:MULTISPECIES: hypothetical protein [Roseobacteraceae]ANT61220.1 hypothetical protein AYJ57_13075 [Salipiger sp. CCB-MM3]MCA0994460.1 hypothetical protein [Alloyangia pacifica]NDV99450.1 hypothetical protein [Salipiger sp. PrR002]NDW58674.1 hypothetical protein [Salipiger sp. PrR004]